jgi:hypothetical protein
MFLNYGDQDWFIVNIIQSPWLVALLENQPCNKAAKI